MDPSSPEPIAQSNFDAADAINTASSQRCAPALQVVSGSLVLAAPDAAPAPDWIAAFGQLVEWLGVDCRLVQQEREHGFRQVARWAGAGSAAPPAPVFAPWQNISPVAFQAAGGSGGLPVGLSRARWVASYLMDWGSARGPARRAVDIMLMSPHPDACRMDEECNAALPAIGGMKAMIAAARTQGRERLAIVVHARCRNAMARQLLAAGRSIPRAGLALEILSIEEAVTHIASGAPLWDAIIALPDLRSIIFALLAETSGVEGPWPMLWHDQGLCHVAGEALEGGAAAVAAAVALDATLLIQCLALAAHHRGAGHAAQRLFEGWARLRNSGVVTPARGSAAPYVNEVSEAAFIDLACKAQLSGGRPIPRWKAIPANPQEAKPRPAARLSLVASS